MCNPVLPGLEYNTIYGTKREHEMIPMVNRERKTVPMVNRERLGHI